MDVSYPVDLFVAIRPDLEQCLSNGRSESGPFWRFHYTNDLNRLTKLAWRTFETFNFTARLDAARISA